MSCLCGKAEQDGQQDRQQTAVANDEDVGVGLIAVIAIDAVDEARSAIAELTQALAARQDMPSTLDIAVDPGGIETVRTQHGCGVLIRYALQDAIVHLSQIRIELDRPLVGDEMRSASCSLQVAGEDRVKLNVGEVLSNAPRLCFANLVERNIDMTLKYSTRVGRSLTMPNEPQLHSS